MCYEIRTNSLLKIFRIIILLLSSSSSTSSLLIVESYRISMVLEWLKLRFQMTHSYSSEWWKNGIDRESLIDDQILTQWFFSLQSRLEVKWSKINVAINYRHQNLWANSDVTIYFVCLFFCDSKIFWAKQMSKWNKKTIKH